MNPGRSSGHEPQETADGAGRADAARGRPCLGAERAAHRAERRSRRSRSDHQPRVRRPARVRGALRQALRRHPRAQDRAAAGDELRVGGRQPLRGAQAASGRQVPRRRAVQRGGGAVQPRAPHDHAGLVPQARDQRHQERGRAQRPDGAAHSLAAAGAVAGRAHRPRRHDGLAEGGQGAG